MKAIRKKLVNVVNKKTAKLQKLEMRKNTEINSECIKNVH